MVYPHEHILIRFNGHFGASGTIISDRWSTGLRFGLPNAAPAYDPVKLQTFVNACQTAASAFHNNAGAFVGNTCWFDQVAGAQVGVSGKYTPTGQLTVLSPLNPVSGSSPPVLPWNSALVTSLRTAVPRGRGSNGRMYWPALAATLSTSTGRINTTSIGTRMTAFKTFIDACNVAAGTYSAGMKAVVASNVGGGLIAYVTSIRADDRLDSIERRENDLAVQWTQAAIA